MAVKFIALKSSSIIFDVDDQVHELSINPFKVED